MLKEFKEQRAKRAAFGEARAAVAKLASMDPQDEAVKSTIDELKQSIKLLESEADAIPDGTAPKASAEEDIESLKDQVNRLHSAAIIPAQNYRRIASITNSLRELVHIASLPHNVEHRSAVQSIVSKVAGVFSEVDTVEDLDKPLEQIEKAIHKLYGDQSKNETYYFNRRGKTKTP